MKTALITGAAGDVGAHLRRELAGKYALRVSDLRPVKKFDKAERYMRADVSKFDDALRITKGVDAVVHLAGYSVEGPWPAILSANIEGCYNVFEAARRNGVGRIVFPSSNHAAGFYRRDQLIHHLVTPRDLAQLVTIGIEHPGIRFEIVYGVSGNTRSWYDNSNARRLGYAPQDDSEAFAAEVLAREQPGDPTAELYQGGAFTVAEEIPNPAPLPRKSRKRRR